MIQSEELSLGSEKDSSYSASKISGEVALSTILLGITIGWKLYSWLLVLLTVLRRSSSSWGRDDGYSLVMVIEYSCLE